VGKINIFTHQYLPVYGRIEFVEIKLWSSSNEQLQ